jgi:hypothetical protein
MKLPLYNKAFNSSSFFYILENQKIFTNPLEFIILLHKPLYK